MRRFWAAYAGAALGMLVFDIPWLSIAGPALYTPLMGHLLRPDIVVWAAVAFYLIYVTGLVILAVRPAADTPLSAVVGRAALYGFCAYATYDLTNMATLKDFPVVIVVADLIWGTVLSSVAAAVGFWSMRRFGGPIPAP